MPNTDTQTKEFSIRAILPCILALIAGMLLVMMDTSIMNIAIPKLQIVFHTDLKMIQWAVTAYTLALAAVIPLSGWFSDRFTNKRVFLISIILFTIFSVLCAFAQTPGQLIVYRILQGIGGGMVAPIGMAMSFTIAPPEKRGSVMGLLGLPMLISPILGPTFSGWVLDYVSWNWIFLINIPLGIIAFILGMKYLPSKKHVQSKKFKLDVWGVLLSPLTFSGLIFSINRGLSIGWNQKLTIISLVISLLSFILFIFVELKQEQPLLELRAFRSKDFTTGIILQWVNQLTLFSSIFLIPLFLQNVKGFSPLEAGLLIIPQAMVSFIGMTIGGKIFDKYGAKSAILPGLLCTTIAILMLSQLNMNSHILVIISIVCVLGIGQGLSMMQIGTHILKSAPKNLISRITPLTNTGMQIFNSLAIALVTAILSSNLDKNASSHFGMTEAFHNTFLVAMSFGIVGIIMTIFIRTPKAVHQKQITKQG